MFLEFKTQLVHTLSFLKEGKLLVAISGGLDSVVLAHLCHRLKLNMALAHCNFKLRGNESDADEAFVSDLAKTLGLEVFVQNFETETYAKTQKLSIQMAARELRYNWFEDLKTQLGFDYILTAHHADDHLETFLINLSRGTGLDGLKGIPEINDRIVRPLLAFPREVIKTYATKNKLKWREDSSNASTKYLRNKLRHEVIPSLKEVNPQFMQNFSKTLAHLNDTTVIVKAHIAEVLKRVIKTKNDSTTHYLISEIKKLNPPKAYLFELFKAYGFSEWDTILNLLTAQTGKQVFSSTHTLLKDRDCLILSKINSKENTPSIYISAKEESASTLMGTLSFETIDRIASKTRNTIYIDKELLKFPLIVRSWTQGDYFYPIGMQGKKKLSKYFKDEKLSLIDKENILLLCSKDAIVWVINKRADDRFKVTDKTKSILKITLQE